MTDGRILSLATGIAAVWRGDWPSFDRACAAARMHGAGRGDVEEMLLQAVLFAGFPRVVTAFERLNTAWPTASAPNGGGLPRDAQAAAGSALFAAIYGKNDAAVRAMLRGCHGEFYDFVLEAAYGRILARPGLPPLERELLACAALAAQDQERQFVAHARGARTFGASLDDLAATLAAAGCEPNTAARWLRAVR
jgi:alkylhydroperoxidase/carboxymuconolactone decarboxylase family protein YurZ